MSNPQVAFEKESNAKMRYLACAKKADEEGHPGGASLFRAAACADEIHAGNHAAVIKKFGGEPEANLALPLVRSTRENLAVAIQGETYERDKMYPDFLRQAKRDAVLQAAQTFSFALAAQAEHARLFRDELANVEGMTEARVFYVCPVCGFTTAKPDFRHCPNCATPKERFEQVS